MGNIFHIDASNNAIPLREEKYESENLLQELIEKHPDILAGEQISPDEPRRWVLISREMGVPGQEDGRDQWFLDHLFIDQDATPTFVEVKRSTDTRIRREVVAQMLDYAANATAYWPTERIRESFESGLSSPASVLFEKLGVSPEDEDRFWEKVESNLRLGRLRLLFVADEIPASLQRIIEFLNSQMVDTEVLGLEIKQYVSNNNQRTLVPKLIGQTVAALQVKKSQDFEWTEELFLNRVRLVSGDNGREVCECLLRDLRECGYQIQWGRGRKHAAFVPCFVGQQKHRPLRVCAYETATRIEIPFSEFKAPFDTEAKQKELTARIETIGKINLPDNSIRPSFDCRLLDDSNYDRFIAIFKDMADAISAYETLADDVLTTN